MSNITKFGPTHSAPGNRTLAEILADEQARYALHARIGMVPNQNLVAEELVFASREEREGATLLRTMLNSAHAVVWDEEATILRVIVSNTTFAQLELWGADNIDFEPTHEV